MPTTTTTYSFNKPVVGADEDDWGGYLNGNWDSVDDLLDGTTPVTGIDINSGTLDGVTIGGTTAGAGTFTTLTANTSITGTLATAAQPNITSVGSLTSLDVGGTVTADGLTVETEVTTQATAIELNGTSFADTERLSLDFSRGGSQGVRLSLEPDEAQTNGDFVIETGSFGSTSDRLRIEANGDISFYEDTGTTAKFFWDASAESLGIGTSSPSQKLEVSDTTNQNVVVRVTNNDGNAEMQKYQDDLYLNLNDTGNIIVRSGSPIAERMRIDSSGNVLVNDGYVKFSENSSVAYIGASNTLVVGGSASDTAIRFDSSNLVFSYSSSEKMRIDSSGNLLVGHTTVDSFTNVGHQLDADGYAIHTRTSAPSLYVGRKTTDGSIMEFNKDGTTVGSIGSTGSGTQPYFVKSSTGGFKIGNDGSTALILPVNADGSNSDGGAQLGVSTNRFKDLYLSGGVYLGGTGAANKLDDYETGTWTPVVEGTTTAGSASYSIQSATYTKIGRLVYWSARIGYTGHTGTGSMIITGLPFTSSNRYASAEYSYRDGLTVPASEDLKVYVPPNVSYVGFYSVALGTDAVAALALDANVTDVSISGVYETT